jgi:hypothetical protein
MRRRRRRRWQDLNRAQQAAILGLGAAQFTLLAAALLDLRRRPAGDVRGPKFVWALASLVNVIGPLAYFKVGRRKDEPPK